MSEHDKSKSEFLIKIINLDRRKDRMDTMLENLEKTSFRNYPIERFSAINGIDLIEDIKTKKLDNDIIWKILSGFKKGDIPKGQLGCFLSHYFLMKKIWLDSTIDLNQMIIIMEDDVHFSKNNYSEEITDIINFDKTNVFDLIYISGRFQKNFTCNNEKMYKKETSFIFKRLNGRGHVWDRTTNSFIIKKKSVPIILDFFIKFLQERFEPVDCIFLRSSIMKYDVFPHLFYSPMNYSTDIQGKHVRDTININEFQQFIKK